jgi:hypothetical protein
MSSEPQKVLAFDPDTATIPPGLSPGAPGEVLALLADVESRVDGWGGRSAVALARGWAAEGRRVFLMDCNPAEPTLHKLLGLENSEGVTDAVLYGVSPSRIAQGDGDGFLFAAAGTVVSDPAAVLRHPRWTTVLEACREAGSTVLLYLPAGEPGADHLVGESDRTIRLAATAPGGGDASAEGVVLYRSEGTAPAASEAPPAQPSAAAAAAAPVGGMSGEPAPSAADSRPMTGEAGGSPPRPAARPVGVKPRGGKKKASPWVLILVLILVGGVLAAVWLGLIPIPGVGPTPAGASELLSLLGST